MGTLKNNAQEYAQVEQDRNAAAYFFWGGGGIWKFQEFPFLGLKKTDFHFFGVMNFC